MESHVVRDSVTEVSTEGIDIMNSIKQTDGGGVTTNMATVLNAKTKHTLNRR